MKITRIETFFVDITWACWTFLELDPDEGVTVVGECTLEGKEEMVVGALKDLSRYVSSWMASYWRATGSEFLEARLH